MRKYFNFLQNPDAILCTLVFLFFCAGVKAQTSDDTFTITGPKTVLIGTTSNYSVPPTVPGRGTPGSYSWTVSSTQVGTSVNGTGVNASVKWEHFYQGGTEGLAELHCVAGFPSGPAVVATIQVKVVSSIPALVPGNIGPLNQTIQFGTSASLTGTSASGGTGTYFYKWQQASPQAQAYNSFTDIPGATGKDYTTTALTSTTYFRRVDSSHDVDGNTITNEVLVTVLPSFSPGVITPSAQSVFPGSAAKILQSGPATGGNGTYTYQWQRSFDLNGWVDVSGATTTSFQPPFPSQATYYRVAVTSGGRTLYSESSGVYLYTCCGPSMTMNYIRTTTPRKAVVSSQLDPSHPVEMGATQEISYLDGLGRPAQHVQVGASPAGKDIVTPISYDDYGREAVKYLPYVAPTSYGVYQFSAISDQLSFYHPYGSASGSQQDNKIINTISPYSVTLFESSPLERVKEQGAPGESWQPNNVRNEVSGRTVSYVYSSNNTSTSYIADGFAVRMYLAAQTTVSGKEHERILSNVPGRLFYEAGQLQVTVVKDENWIDGDGKAGTIEEYKNKDGHIILKRSFNRTKTGTIDVFSTYYVYDDFGNLSFILPPGANPDETEVPATAIIATLCYEYQYDGRKRLIGKKVPGKGWEYILYNNLDQVVATQDANQRTKVPQEWSFNKYDSQGRIIITGVYKHPNSTNSGDYRATIQNEINGQTLYWESRIDTEEGYSKRSWPTVDNLFILSRNYYDDYNIPNLPAGYPYRGLENTDYSKMTRSLPTASQVNILGTNQMLWTVNYYDDYGRITNVVQQHYKGAVVNNGNYDLITKEYNFAGDVVSTVRTHHVAGVEPVLIANRFTFDSQGRPIDTYQRVGKISSPEILLVRHQYNEIGQLKEKLLHSTSGGEEVTGANIVLGSENSVFPGQRKTVLASQSILMTDGFEAKVGSVFEAKVTNSAAFLQKVEYAYNERGWLQQINNPAQLAGDKAFGLRLNYNDHADVSKRQYNGNISGISWQSRLPLSLGISPQQQSYTYSYDKMNRLALADYASTGKPGYFNEELQYDKMGNINALSRKGAGGVIVDQMTYTYDNANKSNWLTQINDVSGSNEGQISGVTNFSRDANGNITSDDRKSLQISYNLMNLPDKITKTTSNETIRYIYSANGVKLRKEVNGIGRDYINGIEYGPSGVDFIQTTEGRAVNSGSSFTYEYALRDHLGNTRVLIKEDGSILQSSDYYAFGLEINANRVTPSPDNKYKYNGKELQTELGLEQYDYGARFYDPVIGRFNVIDRFAEKYDAITPYQYGGLNPISYVDVHGDSLMLFKNGIYVSTIDNGKKEMTGYNQQSKINKKGKEELTGGQSFVFNDIDLDQKDLKSGKMTLNFMGEKEVSKIVSSSGVGNQNALTRWLYAARESDSTNPRGTGQMDYTIRLPQDKLTIINGVAYNPRDGGNYLWGYAMGSMGFTSFMSRAAAHFNDWLAGKQQNGVTSNSSNPVLRWIENRSWTGDAAADQRAIQNGLNDSGSYWKSKLKSFGL